MSSREEGQQGSLGGAGAHLLNTHIPCQVGTQPSVVTGSL